MNTLNIKIDLFSENNKESNSKSYDIKTYRILISGTLKVG